MPNIYGQVGRGCFEKIEALFKREREGEISSDEVKAGIKEALVADGWKKPAVESFAWWIVTIARDLSYEEPGPKDYKVNGMYFKTNPIPVPTLPRW